MRKRSSGIKNSLFQLKFDMEHMEDMENMEISKWSSGIKTILFQCKFSMGPRENLIN